ncbi:hypothetical protein [Dyadobacter frigoris]|uniref:Response regulator n=1 Tax=Dyadobacter frigoris TaxID=2576211 RepID=A0A4U6CUM2_9BACT|nr:hypothetical protein [Dyadobacter frigoris]TKT87425.1 hypothetical protein FDK13_29350 [Dyadobacter frigoris]GLU52325.1 hypothetical protein Dfri01_17860 [Dyadobacter frigoris]
MFKIGYIDEDNGWRNTFRQYFKDDFDVVLFDITETTTQESLVNEIFEQSIDMLVIDFRLDETGLVDFNADSLVEKIKELNFFYPMIILTSYESDALDHIENANLINGKDMLSGDSNSKIPILKQKIKKIASDYRVKLDDSMSRLFSLEKKRLLDGLTPSEEDEFVDLNSFVDKTTSAKGRLSRTFYNEKTNQKLDDLIMKTSLLLNKLDNLNNS